MGPQFLTVGRVTAPWGMRGDVKVEVLTDFPDRFSPQGKVYTQGRELTIEAVRWKGATAIIKLEGVDSVEDAEGLRGRSLEVPQSQLRPLAQDEYYQFQLVGLEVWTTDGELLGKVSNILPTGSNDVYEVPTKDGKLLIPAIEDVVKAVDLESGRITIEVIQGLLPQRARPKQRG